MKKIFIAMLAMAMASCTRAGVSVPDESHVLRSPDGKLELRMGLTPKGGPVYSLERAGTPVIKASRLGYKLIGQDDLLEGFSVADVTTDSFDETWTPVWGEEAAIRNNYNEMLVCLKRQDGVAMNIRFRLFDDGLGFRYEFPLENKLTYFKVAEECSEFAMTGDHTAWWIPGDYDSQ
jgi:hypothetical protein